MSPIPKQPDLTPAVFWGVFFATMRNVAAVIIAMGVLGTTGWMLASPSIDAYLDDKLEAQSKFYEASLLERKAETLVIKEELLKVRSALDALTARMPVTPGFLEVMGGGRLAVTKASYKAGEEVQLLYFVRRNNDCPTTVRVQFFNANTGAISSRDTYDVPSVQASPSYGFQYFQIRVMLPPTMRPGIYSYVPRLIPDKSQCPAERDVLVQPSDFFEVVANTP